MSSNYPESFLESQRILKDPIADDFVAKASQTLDKKELYLLMRHLLDEFSPIENHKLTEEMKAYLEKVTRLPEWADEEQILRGQEFYKLHSPEIAICLMTRALPSTYCCWKGATVVHDSGRLSNHSANLEPWTRRMMETAKFVLNVSSEDGLVKDGVGVQSAAKVRTLHAFIRHFLKNRGWDSDLLGEPINQEDLAGTMLSFSVYVIQGLESIGIKPSKEDKDSFLHMWKVIGHLMGVENQLLPNSYDEGAELGLAILNHQKGASDKGRELTTACIRFTRSQVPWRILKFLPENIMYHQMGKELSEMVGIRKSKNIIVRFAFWVLLQALHIIEWLKHHSRIVRKIALWYNPRFLDAQLRRSLKKVGQPFTPKIIQNEVNVILQNRN